MIPQASAKCTGFHSAPQEVPQGFHKAAASNSVALLCRGGRGEGGRRIRHQSLAEEVPGPFPLHFTLRACQNRCHTRSQPCRHGCPARTPWTWRTAATRRETTLKLLLRSHQWWSLFATPEWPPRHSKEEGEEGADRLRRRQPHQRRGTRPARSTTRSPEFGHRAADLHLDTISTLGDALDYLCRKACLRTRSDKGGTDSVFRVV